MSGQRPPPNPMADLLRGMSAPAAPGAAPGNPMMQGMMGGGGRGGPPGGNPMAAMMQGMMGAGRGGPGGGMPDMGAMMQGLGPMMQGMAAGRGAGVGGAAPPPNPMAMMQQMMGGGGAGGGGGNPMASMMQQMMGNPEMMGNMMKSVAPMVQQMQKNMRSQSTPGAQRRKPADAAPRLQLGPIEEHLAAMHAELLHLVLAPSDAFVQLVRDDGEAERARSEARRLALRRLVSAVQAAFAELRSMLLGLATLLKDPSYHTDAAFRTKVSGLGAIVMAALDDVGCSITLSSAELQRHAAAVAPPPAPPADGDGDDSGSDGFHSAEEDEASPPRGAEAVPPPPPAQREPVLKKPGTASPPSKATLAAAQDGGFAWLERLPESERELWRTVVRADSRRQAARGGAAARERPSEAYAEMSLGKSKRAKPSAIHTLIHNPEQMAPSQLLSCDGKELEFSRALFGATSAALSDVKVVRAEPFTCASPHPCPARRRPVRAECSECSGVRRAHTAIANASAISGHIALVVRGEVSFTEKAAAVQQAGAVGMIAANTEDVLGQLGGDAPVRPPPGPLLRHRTRRGLRHG